VRKAGEHVRRKPQLLLSKSLPLNDSSGVAANRFSLTIRICVFCHFFSDNHLSKSGGSPVTIAWYLCILITRVPESHLNVLNNIITYAGKDWNAGKSVPGILCIGNFFKLNTQLIENVETIRCKIHLLIEQFCPSDWTLIAYRLLGRRFI
jgi:hypothetical protein